MDGDDELLDYDYEDENSSFSTDDLTVNGEINKQANTYIKMDLKQPKPMGQDGNMADNWRKWKQRFIVYSEATDLKDKPEKKQCAVLLHSIGEQGMEDYNTFQFDDAEKNKIESLIDKFEQHYTPKKNLTYERHRFLTRQQDDGEPFNVFLTDLKKKANTCKWGLLHDELIMHKIVIGITNQSVRETLLQDTKLNLQKAIDKCQIAEQTKIQIKEIGEATVVDYIPYRNFKQRNINGKKEANKKKEKLNRTGTSSCDYCGTSHQPRKCPAFGKQCKYCQKWNHYEIQCYAKKNLHAVEEKEDQQEEDSDSNSDSFLVHAVKTKQNRGAWHETIQVNNCPKQFVTFKLDSGAQANILPENVFNSLKVNKDKLKRPNTKLSLYGGTPLPSIGKCILNLRCKNGVTKLVEFHVVKEGMQTPPILGLEDCENLNLIKRINQIETHIPNDIQTQYKDMFKGTRCIDMTDEIIIDKNVKPAIHCARKVPFGIRDKLKEELERLETGKIIKKVSKPTDWVNPIVIVNKPNGKLRLCLDPVDLNKAIKREYYQMPTLDEIASKLTGATVFSTLDANQGFYQIPLATNSQDLCTFATPFGRYQFLRLPYGITSASEVFQKTFKQLL